MPNQSRFFVLIKNPEFQTAIVRLMMWCIGFFTLYYAHQIGYFRVTLSIFWYLFSCFLIISVLLILSILKWPQLKGRRWFALLSDSIAVALAVSATNDVISPFFIVFIWISISYGTRYGIEFLKAGTLVTVMSYISAITYIDGWSEHPFEAYFYLLILSVLPLYMAAMLRQLHNSRSEAQRANQAKSRFLATMTHELRTPLTGLAGMGHLLKTTRLDNQQRQYVNAIESLSKVLKTLIGDILDVSKIEAGKIELEKLPFVIRGVVLDVCNSLTGQALQKGLEITCRFESDVPEVVHGDELRFRQILYNLLGNAVKFTEQGWVSVHVCLTRTDINQPRQIRVEIKDTGIGMPQTKINHIFGAFNQIDDSTTRRYGGTGLGTTIAREVSRMMGGNIGVESKEGEGSLFWVNLPLLPDNFEPEPAVFPQHLEGVKVLALESTSAGREMLQAACKDLGVICNTLKDFNEFKVELHRGNNYDVFIIADEPNTEHIANTCEYFQRYPSLKKSCVVTQYVGRQLIQPVPGVTSCLKPYTSETLAAALLESLWSLKPDSYVRSEKMLNDSKPLNGIRILLAEDNHLVAKVLITLLEQEGYAVTWMENGALALNAITNGNYQLVLADVRMPEMDGIEFTRRYREQENPDTKIPVVALTANAAEEVKDQCLEAGMDAFLVKPVEPQHLFRVVASLTR